MSNKQKNLLEKLGCEVSDDITPAAANIKIKKLIGSQPITDKQKLLVSKIPEKLLNIILRGDVPVENLTFYDVSRILNVLTYHKKMQVKVYHHPIISTINYEYGWQESNKFSENKMYYLSFFDLLMIDIDTHDLDLDFLSAKILSLKLTARLYRTTNGYHIFITSLSINHKSPLAKKILTALESDPFYNAFSYLNGFKVRLSVKENRGEKIAAVYVGILGNPKLFPENPDLLKLMALHDFYISKHQVPHTES